MTARLLAPTTAVIAFLLGACSSDTPSGEPEKEDSPSAILASWEGLKTVAEENDPFAAHRPNEIDCNPLTGWYPEEGALEINTAECNYASLVEPAQTAATAGQRITTEITHFDLTAPEPAEAHIALTANGDVIWEKTIPIPSPADTTELSIALPDDVGVGDPVGIHLHNHGQNTWNITPLRVLQ